MQFEFDRGENANEFVMTGVAPSVIHKFTYRFNPEQMSVSQIDYQSASASELNGQLMTLALKESVSFIACADCTNPALHVRDSNLNLL